MDLKNSVDLLKEPARAGETVPLTGLWSLFDFEIVHLRLLEVFYLNENQHIKK